MPLTRTYRETVVNRLQKDRDFAVAVLEEALRALLDGEKELAFSSLRDVLHACVSFKTLSERTGLPEKSLHRMLGPKGNPTTENLGLVLKVLFRKFKKRPKVELASV